MRSRTLLLFCGVALVACGSSPPVSTPGYAEAPAESVRASAIEDQFAPPAPTLVRRVTEIALTVSDLTSSVEWFEAHFGAVPDVPRRVIAGEAFGVLHDVPSARVQIAHLRLGDEWLTLREVIPTGRPVRRDAVSNDLDFQHLALVVRDIDELHTELVRSGVQSVSEGGPQRMPSTNLQAAGVRAFFFRDADGHPLALIGYPVGKSDTPSPSSGAEIAVLGIDHTAIAVQNTARSVEFYCGVLGLTKAGERLARGVAQSRLTGVSGAEVQVTSLRAAQGPGIELLEYVKPRGGRVAPEQLRVSDRAYAEVSLEVTDLEDAVVRLKSHGVPLRSAATVACPDCLVGSRAIVLQDPDGHAVRLVGS